MSMEIESTHQVNEVMDRYSPLGFRVPGFNDEQKMIEILKSKFPEHVIEHFMFNQFECKAMPLPQLKGIEDLRQPSYLTFDDLTRELKREQNLGNTNIVKQDTYFQVYAIDPTTLSETELAFDRVYDPTSNILSDNDAQIWRATQPSIKLISAKESKLSNVSTVGTTQYIVDGKVVSGGPQSANNAAKSSSIIMQSHLTYQLTANTKNFLFEIKDPIILSANLVERFCKCQKSYEGELMIKCSNDHCHIVWFHPACVGLGNINPKALEDLQFTCEDCKEVERNAKKLAAGGGDKPTRKKATKN